MAILTFVEGVAVLAANRDKFRGCGLTGVTNVRNRLHQLPRINALERAGIYTPNLVFSIQNEYTPNGVKFAGRNNIQCDCEC